MLLHQLPTAPPTGIMAPPHRPSYVLVLILCVAAWTAAGAFVPQHFLSSSPPARHGHGRPLRSSKTAVVAEQPGGDNKSSKGEDGPGRPRICILGGGFGGLYTALSLSDLPWGDNECDRPIITLVDRKERFVFLPLLYELCVGDASLEEVAPTYCGLLDGTGIEFARREVAGIDVENGIVHVSEAVGDASAKRDRIPYDALIVATGAQVDLSGIPGAAEYALPFYTVEQCYELRRRFEVIESQQRGSGDAELTPTNVVVVGGGYSGVELALNALERLGKSLGGARVTLVHGGEKVLQYATDYNRKKGQDRLDRAGVEVLTGTSVVEVISAADIGKKTGDSYRCRVVTDKSDGVDVSSDEERTLDADLLLWTAGATPPPLDQGVLNSILPRDKKGRIVTGKLLRAKGLSNVFAVGDCSRAKQVPYPGTAQVAMQQAPVAAWNAYATLTNRRVIQSRGEEEEVKLLPFNFADLGEMMTLGSDDATVSSLGGLVTLDGEAASVLRRLVYAFRMPTLKQGAKAATESMERRLLQAKAKREKVISWM